MHSRLHISFFLVVFIFLLLLTWWLDQITRPSDQANDSGLFQNPDYIAEDLSGIRMEYATATQRKFTAEKLLHFVADEITQMEHVNFINTEPAKPLMRIKAERAEIRNKGKDVFLSDNVTAIRGADDESGKITLVTHFLHIIPDEGLVKTDQAVKITKLNTTINAIGMELNNQTGVIELLSRVKAVDNK